MQAFGEQGKATTQATTPKGKKRTSQLVVKGPTSGTGGLADEAVLNEFKQWSTDRLMPVEEGEAAPDAAELDFWFGQKCLICNNTVTKLCWPAHSTGGKHT